MDIKPIETMQDYEQAMERLERVFDAKPGTPEGSELEVLSILIEKYEDDITQLFYRDLGGYLTYEACISHRSCRNID